MTEQLQRGYSDSQASSDTLCPPQASTVSPLSLCCLPEESGTGRAVKGVSAEPIQLGLVLPEPRLVTPPHAAVVIAMTDDSHFIR